MTEPDDLGFHPSDLYLSRAADLAAWLTYVGNRYCYASGPGGGHLRTHVRQWAEWDCGHVLRRFPGAV
jgi:hypothetical protein